MHGSVVEMPHLQTNRLLKHSALAGFLGFAITNTISSQMAPSRFHYKPINYGDSSPVFRSQAFECH